MIEGFLYVLLSVAVIALPVMGIVALVRLLGQSAGEGFGAAVSRSTNADLRRQVEELQRRVEQLEEEARQRTPAGG